MKLADLTAETIEQIKTLLYDRILEKHEGPAKWVSQFQYGDPEFMMIDNRAVLLPVEREQHANITVLRAIVGEDGTVLTLFLKDTTYVSDPQWEYFEAGRLAFCEKMPGHDFYIATVYHEWFIIQNPVFNELRE